MFYFSDLAMKVIVLLGLMAAAMAQDLASNENGYIYKFTNYIN